MEKPKYDLEDRLVEYTCRMIDVVEALPHSRARNYIAGQLIKSCHSPTFNYGEVQAAESRDDFIHKLAVALKELKECRTALKVIMKKELIKSVEKLHGIFKETEELIAIIAKSKETAKHSKTANKLNIEN
ncbi:MAG: four helix bundle protein [Chitinophagaceae bacterium]